MSLTKSDMSSTSFNPPELLTKWMSPCYKFKSTNLRAPFQPGTALRLCQSRLTQPFCFKGHLPSLRAHALEFWFGIWGLNSGKHKARLRAVRARCLGKHVRKCPMSDEFLFHDQLFPNKNGCSFREPNLPHGPRGGRGQAAPRS